MTPKDGPSRWNKCEVVGDEGWEQLFVRTEGCIKGLSTKNQLATDLYSLHAADFEEVSINEVMLVIVRRVSTKRFSFASLQV